MSEIKARINSLGELIEIGHIEGLDFNCPMPFDFIDRFYNYKPAIEGNSIIDLCIINKYINWHEQTKYQIKFAPVDLLELLRDVPAMIECTNTLTTYVDEFGHQYLYVNYFVDMEKELCERYGAIINERT